MKKVSCVLLAAGLGQRAKAIKPLLPFGNSTFLEKTFRSLKDSKAFSEILVVTGHAVDKLTPVLEKLEARVAHNPHFIKGMHSSIRKGLESLGAPSEGACIAVVDQPQLEAADYALLVETFRQTTKSLVRPKFGGQWGNPSIISSRYYSEIFSEPDTDKGCHYLFDRYVDEIEFVEMPDGRCLRDFDFIAS